MRPGEPGFPPEAFASLSGNCIALPARMTLGHFTKLAADNRVLGLRLLVYR